MGRTYCLFSAHYPPHPGGIEKYTKNLAQALAERGNSVLVVTNNLFDSPGREQPQKGIEVIRLPCHKFLRGRYPLPRRNRQYKALLNYIDQQVIDFVIINARFYPHSFTGIGFAERREIRPIVIDHGTAHLTIGNALLDKAVRFVEHRMTSAMKNHDADYYAVSAASVLWLEHFGIKAKGVLSNSINAKEFRALASLRDFRSELSLSKDAFLAVFIGRLESEKGLYPLLEAAEHLKSNPSIHFALAGSGSLRSHIASKRLKNVHLLGTLPEKEVSALLRASDTFCLPTRSEGFSTVLLEAAAWGVTPVITRVGGAQELIPSNNYGFTLSHANGKEIAETIALLFKNRELNKALGQNIQKRVEEQFSWKETARHVELACEQTRKVEVLRK